jgi:tetratricopeptide (TPR) repeat protein
VTETTRVATVLFAATLVLGAPARGASAAARSRSAHPPVAPPAAAPATPPQDLAAPRGQELLDQAWAAPGSSLTERARRVRAAALELGIWSFDPGARAILHDSSLGPPLERAEAAAMLAPELPDAGLALARARLGSGDLRGALDAAGGAIGALLRHPEGAPWMRAAVLDVAARAAIFGGLLFLAVAGLGAVASLAMPVALRLDLPTPSAAALLGALLLLPAAAGEGAFGVGLACGALALVRAEAGTRAALLAAALLALAGLHGLADRRDRALALMTADPVGLAALAAERDFGSPVDLLRLERAADRDDLARQALALHARRSGDVQRADRLFRALLVERPDPAADLLNNAANTRLAAGRPDEALALYERAVRTEPSPLVLFNLAQAYGRAILLDEQDLALAQAQALDPRAVHTLTEHASEVGSGGPVDVALSLAELGGRVTAPVRRSNLGRRFAPGRLGGSAPAGLAGIALAAGLGALGALALRRLGSADDFYAGVARLLQGRGATDPAARMARLAALRAREARLALLRRLAAWSVPGAAGLQAGQGALALLTVVLAAAAGAALAGRHGLVPDPLTAGATGAFVFGCAASVALLGCAGCWGFALARLRRGL